MKEEQIKRIIEAENLLTKVGNDFIDFIVSVQDKLTGKKIILADGSKSKYFAEITKPFFDSLTIHMAFLRIEYGNKLSLSMTECVSGGSYDVRPSTAYCTYVERSMYNIITYDNNGVFVSINAEKSSYPNYSVNEYREAGNNINKLRQQLEQINDQIRAEEKRFPHSLQQKYTY